MSPSSGEIHQTKLKGHKGSVLCLAHSCDIEQGSCLLSGAEDGTARLWDLRCSSRAALCLVVGEEVTCVAFAPPTGKGTTSSPFSWDYLVYLSVANRVYGYDLRKAVAPIVREYTHDLSSVLENEEEVNQISLSTGHGSNQALHLAAADDGGTVRVTDCLAPTLSTQRRRRVLHHDVDALAMVTSVEFRPKGLGLASGGTDCTVHLWDITRPRRPSSSYQIQRDDAGANQVCNPPMVHSLSWSPSGRLLAAGLGDGTCSVFRVDGRRSLTEVGRLREGHDAAVACVVFPEFAGHQNHHVASHDQLLASAGNDGAIFLWDLGTNIAGDGAVDPASLFADEMIATTERPLEDGMKGLSLTSDARILFGIPHQQKPNWLVSSRQTGPPSLFVADTTNDITAYTLPMR